MTSPTRLHHLDWLRVLAFGLLIFYHTGMLYVTWPYHVKSPRIVAGVEWAMVLANPWRLALLFFISGVASRFLLLVVLAVALFPARLPLWLEAGLVAAGPFGVCLFVYELAVRRSSLLRFLFGLKHEPARAGETRRAPGEPVAG